MSPEKNIAFETTYLCVLTSVLKFGHSQWELLNNLKTKVMINPFILMNVLILSYPVDNLFCVMLNHAELRELTPETSQKINDSTSASLISSVLEKIKYTIDTASMQKLMTH